MEKINPSLREYSQDSFRKHFHSCLMKQSISTFSNGTIVFKPKSVLRRVKIFVCVGCLIQVMIWLSVLHAAVGITLHVLGFH